MKNIFNNLKNLLHAEESFVQWRSSMDVKGAVCKFWTVQKHKKNIMFADI